MSVSAAGRTMELLDDVLEFYRDYYKEDINKLAQLYPNDRRALYVSWDDLHSFDADNETRMAEGFLESPGQLRPVLEEALAEFDIVIDVDLSGASVRMVDLPESHTHVVGGVSPSDARGTYRSFTGQVTKVTEVRPNPVEPAFECQRCGTLTRIPQTGDGFQEPHECQSCERQGPFRINFDESEIEDVQRIKLEEPPEEAAGGQGATLEAVVRDDLTDEVTGGDRVTLTGTLHMVADTSGQQTTFDTYLETDVIDVDETDFEDLDIDAEDRERIEAIANGAEGDPIDALVESLAPGIRGYRNIKESLVLQLASGVRAFQPDGSLERGVIHVVLIGDPGTAKSTLLSRVNQLAPRSTYASGKGASEAGMTAAAVADDFGDTKWSLDAGAMVVADQGVACVDEIDKVPEDVVSSLHGALSQTVVHVNKAGINTSLQTRTSLLAAGNPTHGRFDPYEAVFEQIDISPTLRSRFDLMFVLKDQPDEEEDAKTSHHIATTRELAKKASDPEAELTEEEANRVEPVLNEEIVRKYIAVARQLDPRIRDPDVLNTLEERFVALRGANGYSPDDPVPVTWRKQKGTHRLAEASARARLSDTIEMQDVERAQRLIGTSMQQLGVDEDDRLDTDVVETGTSKSQQQRMKAIDSIINSLQREYDEGAPIDVVIERADDRGIPESKAEHAIEKLKRKGEIVEPRTDHFRSI